MLNQCETILHSLGSCQSRRSSTTFSVVLKIQTAHRGTNPSPLRIHFTDKNWRCYSSAIYQLFTEFPLDGTDLTVSYLYPPLLHEAGPVNGIARASSLWNWSMLTHVYPFPVSCCFCRCTISPFNFHFHYNFIFVPFSLGYFLFITCLQITCNPLYIFFLLSLFPWIPSYFLQHYSALFFDLEGL